MESLGARIGELLERSRGKLERLAPLVDLIALIYVARVFWLAGWSKITELEFDSVSFQRGVPRTTTAASPCSGLWNFRRTRFLPAASGGPRHPAFGVRAILRERRGGDLVLLVTRRFARYAARSRGMGHHSGRSDGDAKSSLGRGAVAALAISLA